MSEDETDLLKWWTLYESKSKVVGVAIVYHGFKAELHSHPADETYVFLYGEGELYVGGKVRHMFPGQRVKIPGGVPHAMTPLSNYVVLLYYFPNDGPFDSIEYTFHGECIPRPTFPAIFHSHPVSKEEEKLVRTSRL